MGHQNDGAVSDQMNASSMAAKWKGIGWNTIVCDGHDITALIAGFQADTVNIPKVLIAQTIKGRGVGFMESNNDWHHNRLSQKLYDEAVKGLLQ